MKKNNILSLALLTGSLFATTSVMAQDMVVTMTTDKSVGSSMTLMVNHTYNGVTVDWGDNNPQVYKNNDAKPFTITGEVKGKTITVKGDQTWELLQCSDCGLTSIDLTQARELRSLYCQNNKLTTLDLKKMSKLTDLNCSNNELTQIAYTSATNPGKDLSSIEYYNVANNHLSGSNGTFQIGTRSEVQSTIAIINVSNNNFEKVTLQYAPNVTVLKSSHNNLTGIDLSKNERISSLLLNDNQIMVKRSGNDRFNLKLPVSSLTQLVIDNNQIDSMSLMNYSSMKDLSCKNNGMAVLVLPQQSSFHAFDICNNKLSFNALPVYTSKPVFCNFLPQDSIDIFSAACVVTTGDGASYIPVCPSYEQREEAEFALDLAKYRATANNTNAVRTTIEWYAIADDGTSKELVKGTNTSADYWYSQGVTAFFKPQKRVYAVLTQNQYKYQLATNSIAIGEDNAFLPSAIGNVETTGNNGLQIRITNGSITMSSQSPTSVRIYSIEGKTAWSGTVKAEETTVNLSKGIYIVNGKKVIL